MSVQIGERTIGRGQPAWLVAEVSCNHAGSLKRAHRLVDAAAEAGADAVKFQAYQPWELTLDSSHLAYRLAQGPWAGQRLWDLYQRAQTPRQWLPELFRHAIDVGLEPFCSVFSESGVWFAAHELGARVLKVASAEVPWLQLVRECAATGLPVIISDGMATTNQLAGALDALQGDAVMLHCVSEYPAPPSSYRLQLIADVGKTVLPVGLSDHTTGHDMAVASVALGACVVEKHLMLDRWQYWRAPLDAGHSVTPSELAELVSAVRATEEALAGITVLGRPMTTGTQWRRRLVFRTSVNEGFFVTSSMVLTVRCGMGMEADEIDNVMGRRVARDVEAGEPITMEVLL